MAANLTILDVPDAFTLETVTRIVPQKNTKLEGLYATKSGLSWGMADLRVPKEKGEIIGRAEEKVTKIRQQFEEGW